MKENSKTSVIMGFYFYYFVTVEEIYEIFENCENKI